MEIEIEEALSRSDLVFIDLRSPGEHAESSIPGSINIPLFDDSEHNQLGLIYHEQGEHAARKAALRLLSPKLPELVESVTAQNSSKIPLLYCARGGMRSLSLYQVISLTGYTVFRLKQGYKAYRRYVNKELEQFRLSARVVVLHGLTGVGKTTLLNKLEEKNLPVLDLEGIARHRGSVFGAVGTGTPRSQKDFDAILLKELSRTKDKPYMVVEGEGKRIGNVYLPMFLVEAMKEGHQVLLTAPLETRVDRIIEEYNPGQLSTEEMKNLLKALESLRRRLGDKKIASLVETLERGDYRAVVKILCTDYYDHYYSDSRPESASFDDIIDATDLDLAADCLCNKITKMPV